MTFKDAKPGDYVLKDGKDVGIIAQRNEFKFVTVFMYRWRKHITFVMDEKDFKDIQVTNTLIDKQPDKDVDARQLMIRNAFRGWKFEGSIS